MSDIVGIDLGTTNSLIGVMDSGFPILIADRDGSRLTPSVVYIPETGDHVVGAQVLRQAIAPVVARPLVEHLGHDEFGGFGRQNSGLLVLGGDPLCLLRDRHYPTHRSLAVEVVLPATSGGSELPRRFLAAFLLLN